MSLIMKKGDWSVHESGDGKLLNLDGPWGIKMLIENDDLTSSEVKRRDEDLEKLLTLLDEQWWGY